MENLTTEQIRQIVLEHEQMQSDIITLRDNVFKISDALGLRNPDGTFKEKPSFTKLMPKLMGYITNTNALVNDFGFISEALPLLDRYKHLAPNK